MFDWLIPIPGPTFIKIFLVYAGAVILTAILYRRGFGGLFQSSYEPTEFSPYELGYLRGGVRGIIRTVLVTELQAGRLEVGDRSGEGYLVSHKGGEDGFEPDSIAGEICSFLGKERPLAEVYAEGFIYGSGDRLREQAALCEKRLVEKGLYEKWRGSFAKVLSYLIFAFLILAPGGSKLYFGLLLSKPSNYLIAALIISLLILGYVIFKIKRGPTWRGWKLLRGARYRFGWVNRAPDRKSPEFINDFTYFAAVFPLSYIYTGIFEGLNSTNFECSSEFLPGLFSIGGAWYSSDRNGLFSGLSQKGGNSSDGGCGSSGCSGGCDGGCGGCGGCGD